MKIIRLPPAMGWGKTFGVVRPIAQAQKPLQGICCSRSRLAGQVVPYWLSKLALEVGESPDMDDNDGVEEEIKRAKYGKTRTGVPLEAFERLKGSWLREVNRYSYPYL